MNGEGPSAPIRLPRALVAALEPVSAAAREAGVRVAVVGGVVRDRLLGRRLTVPEADLVVEGDARDLARRVARATGSALREYERFGTATLTTPAGWSLDLARARRETYARPGALPEVFPAALEEDLARRDFTVNSMAYELAGGSGRARFHDPFGGSRDAARRTLRILHEKSFEDDPTRALRAVRYANRLGLRLEARTRRRLAEALDGGALDTVSGDRIRRELERTLEESHAAGAVRLLVSLGIARRISPELDASEKTLSAIERAERFAARMRSGERAGETTWFRTFLVWAGSSGLSAAACGALAGRLSLAGPARRALERWPGARSDSTTGSGRMHALSLDERVAAAALLPAGSGSRSRSGIARRRLLAPPVTPSIRGADLVRAGIPAGPLVGLALARTARALQDGRIRPDEELAFALASAHETGERE